MHAVFRRIALWFALAGGAAACGLALLTVVSIVMRATLSRPIQGDVELMQMGIALCISLFLPWCQLQRANIIVDFFTQKLPQRPQRCRCRSRSLQERLNADDDNVVAVAAAAVAVVVLTVGAVVVAVALLLLLLAVVIMMAVVVQVVIVVVKVVVAESVLLLLLL